MQCELAFFVPPHRQTAARFCGRPCAIVWRMANNPRTGIVPHTCEECGKEFNRWRKDTMRRFCAQPCRAAFNRKRRDAHNPKFLRHVAFERDGQRCVDCGGVKFLEVHHVNGNHGDNRLDNLATVCKKCHVKRHIILRNGITPTGKKALAPWARQLQAEEAARTAQRVESAKRSHVSFIVGTYLP